MQQQKWFDVMKSIKKTIDSTVEAVQRIAADLRPSLLDELGPAAAIDWVLESFSAHTGIQYEAVLPIAPMDFTPAVSTTIFRILQESLTNVGRHSKASLVVVELKEMDDLMVLKITDNGKGIDRSNGREKSLGLLGMRERARMLGGKLSIQSRIGAGTSIELQIPKNPTSKELT
jgi:signal transduction histidine kinase